MSWGIRAHIRNVFMRASLGASFVSAAELRNTGMQTSVRTSPYPVFDAEHVNPLPTDDALYAAHQLELAWQRLPIRLPHKSHLQLHQCVQHSKSADLVCDLFWHFYLLYFGVKYAPKGKETQQKMESFRLVLMDMFVDADEDGSGSIDSEEFSHILGRLGVTLPPDCCRELIDLVDDNGNGALEMDEFIRMMCVELIADYPLEVIEKDILLYKQRSSRVFCEILSPFDVPLLERDDIVPFFCRILAETVQRCLMNCYTDAEVIFGPGLLANIQESIMLRFAGMRRPQPPTKLVVKAPLRSRGASRTPMQMLQHAKVQGDEAVLVGNLSFAGPLEVTQMLSTTDMSVDQQPQGESVWTEREDLQVDSLRNELIQMRLAAKPFLSRPQTANKALTRQKQHFFLPHRKPEEVKVAVPKRVLGQPLPKPPKLNLKGCSPAFDQVFHFSRPYQPLVTLQPEQFAGDFEEGKYSKLASIYTPVAQTPRTFSSEPPLETKAVNSARAYAKEARKDQRFLRQKKVGAEVEILEAVHQLQQEWNFLNKNLLSNKVLCADNPIIVSNHLDKMQQEFYKVLQHPYYRYLHQEQRRMLRDQSNELAKRKGAMKRESAFQKSHPME